MSVWEATTYKLETAKAIFTYLQPQIATILGPTVGSYLSPRGELHSILPTDDWEELADLLGWEYVDPDTDDLEDIALVTTGVHKWLVGMHGVYALVHAIRRDRFQVRHQYDYSLIEKRLHAIRSVVSASTLNTPAAFKLWWERYHHHAKEQSRRFDDAAEAWKFYARSMDLRKAEFQEIDQTKYFGRGERMYYGGSIGTLVILRGSSEYKERGIIMTRKHLDMLIGACLRIAGVLDYAAHEYANDKSMVNSIIGMLDFTIDAAYKCSRVNIDKVVQALHKARSYMHMRMFANEMLNTFDEACEEFQKKNLQTIINLGEYVRMFGVQPKGRWLDLLHVYKWMPPPDFDATYSFQELYEHHMSPRKSALDTGATIDMKKLWLIIVRERKLNVATAYLKMYGKWPASLSLTDNFPTKDQLDAWEPRALFPYFTYGKDITAQVKDKATVLSRMGEEINAEGRVAERNFLLWYLMNYKLVDTNVVAEQVVKGSLPEDNYVRVAYKGEAHKPGSRLFFMAPPLQRVLLGEMEGNISRVAQTYPASLQGIDALTRANKLEKLFSLEETSFAVDSDEPYTGYIVTFDLSKFSPKFNPAVLRDLHVFWASVFDYLPIIAYGKLGAESTILHTTNKLVMHYENRGADLEGFRGRMMTLFHADLIAAACRVAKEKGYIIGKANSAVFIDDGAVKIAAVGVGSVANNNALKFLRVMQQVYEAAGQENHPNKTIVSSIGGELLSEQYLYGQRLKCAIKAGMRLFPSYELPAACITEEFDSLFSTAQGSIKDGATWVPTYRRLAEGYLKSLYRWARKEFSIHSDVRFAFRFVTPKSMGGFGFPTLQALTTTTAYDMTAEGLGILNSAAKTYKEYETEVEKILGRNVVIRAPVQVLRDPGRVRMEGEILIEGRLTRALIRKLSEKTGPWSNFLCMSNDPEIEAHAHEVAIALLSRESVSLPLLRRAWDCLPLSFVESVVLKFQRSSSVQALLTDKEIMTVRRANQRDVWNLLKNYF